MTEKDLFDNIKEYKQKAEDASREGSYNVAATLFFKAIAILIDLFILQKEGNIPINHNERFRILEIKYPLLYKILDKDFPLYQQSYRTKLTKKYVDILKNDLQEVIKFTGIKID